MTRDTVNEDLPDLTERILVRLLGSDTGWSGALAQIPGTAREKLSEELTKGMSSAEADEVIRLLERAFGTAVELAMMECRLQRAAGDGDGSKKASRKLGVRLRGEIGDLLVELEKDSVSADKIASRILDNPILERLVTPLLEESLAAEAVDPLRNAPEQAAKHLPDALGRLHSAIRAGVTTGRGDSALDYLASAVVISIKQATGRMPGRTWIEERVEETGFALEVCRLLATSLNNALPEDCRRERPADMAKAFRRAIEANRPVG